ncbi:MAG: DUF5719 family protein [Propionibacterium sp.]|nr:DUF5719 family protein [Propionibacterium sp.]
MSTVRSRVVGIGVGVAMTASLVAVGTADLWVPAPGDRDPVLPTQRVSPSSMTLACAPGIGDPYDAGASLAPGSHWASRGTISSGAAPSLTAMATAGATGIPSTLVVAGQGGGELRGLATLPCTAPATEQWIAAGSTAVGEDLLLVLSNPSGVASQVSISSYGAAGPSEDSPQSVNVPAGQVVELVPATWFPDQDRPAFRISADGPGVSAWVQSSGLDGEVPTGVGAAPASAPGTDLVLPGVRAATSASVRLVVPGEDTAHVSLGVSGESGMEPLAGAENLEVEAGTPLDVDLTGVPDAPSTLVVTSDAPVVAMADMRTEGSTWPDSDQRFGARTLVVPSTATTAVDLPSLGDLQDLVKEQLGATVMRATTVSTPSGGTNVKARVVLSAPSGNAATVSLGTTGVDLPAGATMVVDLPTQAGSLSSDRAVHAAVVVDADTPTGPLGSVWPLGTTGISSLELAVDIAP